MFVRNVSAQEIALKSQTQTLIPQLKEEDINDGRFFEEAKTITVSQNLYNYGRNQLTTEMPRHSLGYDFAIDRSIEPINPARAIPNPETPPEVLSKIAMPDLPPKMFSM